MKRTKKIEIMWGPISMLDFDEKEDEDKEQLQQAYVKLQEAYDRLNDLIRMKDEILSNISHELRTPLTVISGAISFLEDDLKSEEATEYVEMIKKNIDRQNRIIGSLVDCSKIESYKMRIEPTPIDVKELLNEKVKEFDDVIRDRGIELEIDIENGTQFVYADGDSVNQIVSNLIDNAIKFCEGGKKGKVAIEAETLHDYVRFCVEDNGIGISKEAVASIFDYFYQADGSSSRRYSGVGLGLAIVKNLVELNKGRVWVESEEGQGSRFYFTLPIKRRTAGKSQVE